MSDYILKRIIQDMRPWGNFIQYAHNEKCTVKIITVTPGGMLSLQSHKSRDELWVILDEGLRVEVGDRVLEPKPGETVTIMRGTKHRLSSAGKTARLLEIAFGDFDEDDIVRYEDVYGRIPDSEGETEV